MKTKNNVLNYYNGIMSYYNCLLGNLGYDTDVESIKNEDSIKAAKVAFMALFFETKKEDMIDEIAVDEDLKEYISKVNDEALIGVIEQFAKDKVNGKYVLGDYETKSPYGIIAYLRHSFAHSRYCVDLNNNKILINNKGYNVNIDIDDLLKFVVASCHEAMRFPKTKKHYRYDFQMGNPLRKRFTNKEDIKSFLKNVIFCEHNLYSSNNDYLNIEALGYFDQLLAIRGSNSHSDESKRECANKFLKIAKKNNADYVMRSRKITKMEIEEIVNFLDNTTGFYDMDTDSQVNFTLRRLGNKCSQDGNDMYLSGLMFNLITLGEMALSKEPDFKEVSRNKSIKLTSVNADSVLTSIFAAFNAMYIYPLETMYTNDLKYSLDRKDEFDFSKLDLSFIKPTILNINDKPLKEQEKLVASLIKKAETITKEKEKIEANLLKAKEKNNQKGIEMQEKKYAVKEYEEYCAYDKMLDEVDLCVRMEDDFELMSYHRNKAIIVGLRNSIAHGHVKIKRFSGETSIDDTIILFQDIYKGDITFEAEVTIKELKKLIEFNTIEPLINYLEDKYNYEEPVVEETIEEDLIEEEKGFQKVFKRIFKRK